MRLTLPWNVTIEGEIYGGVITKGTRIISYEKGAVIGSFNKDVDAAYTQRNGINEKDIDFNG